MHSSLTRRDFFRNAGAVAGVATFGGGALGLLEACGNQSSSTTTTSGNLTGQLEIFSWWTGPGEK